jgi:TM2 domain-containing membrane protein YozV
MGALAGTPFLCLLNIAKTRNHFLDMEGEMKKNLVFSFFCFLVFFLCFTPGWNSWSAESSEETRSISEDTIKTPAGNPMIEGGSAPGKVATSKYTTPRQKIEPKTDGPTYPLFRSHSPKYYPPKGIRTATLLSATLPGLGQTYAGSPGKGVSFLIAEIGLLSVAGRNLDRALHYDELADRFATGFYDPYSDNFLTTNQGRVRARSHATLGTVFLASGIGVYIWNIFDAAQAVNRYNERRFPAQVQQTVNGDTYLTVTHRF